MVRITADFYQAVAQGKLQEAEAWLEAEKSKPTTPGHDKRWADHRERELFRVYCARRDWISAKRVVESSIFNSSRQGRIRRLKQLSGRPYHQISS